MKHKVKRDIIKCKKKLENSIKALEEKILRLEIEYHQNCNVNGGNLMKGWDNYLRKASLEPLCFKTFRDDYMRTRKRGSITIKVEEYMKFRSPTQEQWCNGT
ncbi:hypothetical protein PCYB_143870 [Plasmodium cynomolgi strain B]|uniref:Histone acetyltransferase subunit NuA4 n=1 Tax=Plasmodium cynomolgi (strain B) TaxID=1120755 RepID=K6UYJ5_PLACD|nr:hypothetical protein PCYB_143870 [Plasmodium cynomolgi strain B]GAB68959.1 hypothetical protein PCYB_143870 [Plasmodium cynomolgi strain B]